LLITGASGSGKSSLALQLMALGAGLVADDRVVLEARDGVLTGNAPDAIAGLIEARGMGILRAEPHGPAAIVAVVDCDRTEAERLPPRRFAEVLGIHLPILHKGESAAFPAALMQYLKSGFQDE